MQPKANRISVVFIYARDLAKLRSFYEQAFDLGKPLIDAKWWIEYALGDGSHLALHQGEDTHFDGANPGKNTVKFSIDVTNIGHFVAKLTGLGAKFHYGPRVEYGFTLAEFEDSEGNCVRLYEKTKK